MKRSGSADLPLHGGKVPAWLYERMRALGVAVTEAVVAEYGRGGFLSRISDPFWFQALGCVMGMDWHSSGITTSVMGALKHGINPISRELGIHVCGGRGAHSRRTPDELLEWADRTGLDGSALVQASRLSAKVDNTCVQDGFSIYLHSFIVTADGEWAVVQQGMSPERRLARRYHWHSPKVRSFTADPHEAVVGENRGEILNLSDARSVPAQESITGFLRRPPAQQLDEIRRLTMPARHHVAPIDVNSKRLGAVLALAHESSLAEFRDALLLPGVGPRTLQALALVSEIIYGRAVRFQDPARFAFAHGGKDGHPHPVPLSIYDETISVLRRALDASRVPRTEKLDAIRRLSRLTEQIESDFDPHADVDALIRKERAEAWRYGGMTVAGPSRPPDAAGESGLRRQPPQRGRKRRNAGAGGDVPGQLPLF